MSDAKSANSDPSMDDILASIRRIISDDEARAQVGSQTGSTPSPRPAVVPPVISSADTRRVPERRIPGRDDVLLLTDPVDPPQADAPSRQPMPTPLRRIDPAHAADMPQPSVEPSSDAGLVGSGAAVAANSAFARLNQVVQESVPAPVAPDPGPAVDGKGKTIEDLVKEMLRPMLKEWLDRNLPPMVERFVEREIVRLTRR